MFSIITIASSTTKPTATVIAIRDRLSTEKPQNHMAPNVPASESGTATAAAAVEDTRRRNRKTTIITRPMEMANVICKSRMDARMVVERSDMIEKLTPAGIHLRSSGRTSFTPSIVSMILAVASLVTLMMTAGWPLYQPAVRLLRTPGVTVATSPTSTMRPFWERMGIRAYSSLVSS